MPDEPTNPAEWIRVAVDRYEAPLVLYAQRITGELETARDVVQEAFLRLCRERQSEVEDHLAQWLYTVCRRRALDVQKKESRMKTLTNGAALEQSVDEGALAGHVAELERSETLGQVQALLARLPANQQEVVRLKFQAGLSYREISHVTNLSVSNVGYLIHTALATLRRQLNAATV